MCLPLLFHLTLILSKISPIRRVCYPDKFSAYIEIIFFASQFYYTFIIYVRKKRHPLALCSLIKNTFSFASSLQNAIIWKLFAFPSLAACQAAFLPLIFIYRWQQKIKLKLRHFQC